MPLGLRFSRPSVQVRRPRLGAPALILLLVALAGGAGRAQDVPATTASPVITSIGPSPSGYAIVGRAFGTDRSRLAVIENGVVLPPAAIAALTDGRIEVRSAPSSTVAVSVRVGARLSAPVGYRPVARAPAIAAVAPTAQGYAILGTGFGADRSRVMVAENNAVLPPATILALADNRIDVRSAPAGAVAVTVRAGAMVSAAYSYQPAPGGAGPAIAGIAPTAQGYSIMGRGFGVERGRVQVVENGVVLPPAALDALSDSRIDVRSAPSGAVAIAVVVGPMASAPYAYQAAAQPPLIAAVAPTAQGFTITGSFFGSDRARVLVAQNNVVLPAAAVLAVADSRIDVRAPLARAAVIAVRVGTVASAPFDYRAAARPPVIAAIAPAPQGYVITGSGFGTDRSAVMVAENGAVLLAGAIAAVNDGRIEVRSASSGELTIAVRVGSLASQPARHVAGRPPTIAAILRTTQGYAVLGAGFGSDPARVEVTENGRALGRAAILRVADDRIDVRAALARAVTIGVRAGGVASAGFAFRAGASVPTITVAVPTPRGYTIVGAGFGGDRRHVVVIENNAALPPDAITSLNDREIVVRSPTAGARTVIVQVAGQTSAPVAVPPPLRRPSSAAR